MLKPRFKRQEKEIGALPLEQNFAKTCVSADGEIVLGQTVFQHCRNVGLVAQAISEYLPETLRERWLPSPAIAAALHDVGKASPTFQERFGAPQPAIFRAVCQSWHKPIRALKCSGEGMPA